MHLASQSNLNAVAFLRRAVRLFIHARSPRCVSGDRRSSEYQVSGRIVGAHPSKPPVSPRCNPRRLPDGRWGWCVPTSAMMSNARRGELYSEDARCDHMVGEYFQESAVVCNGVMAKRPFMEAVFQERLAWKGVDHGPEGN
jgi:hypothetical protein